MQIFTAYVLFPLQITKSSTSRRHSTDTCANMHKVCKAGLTMYCTANEWNISIPIPLTTLEGGTMSSIKNIYRPKQREVFSSSHSNGLYYSSKKKNTPARSSFHQRQHSRILNHSLEKPITEKPHRCFVRESNNDQKYNSWNTNKMTSYNQSTHKSSKSYLKVT